VQHAIENLVSKIDIELLAKFMVRVAGEGAKPPSNPPTTTAALKGIRRPPKRDTPLRHALNPRGRVLKIRVSQDELAVMRERAAGDAMSVSNWLRVQVARVQKHSHPRRPRPPSPEVADALRQLARIGSLLNQIARWENTRRQPADVLVIYPQLVEVQAELTRIRQLILADKSQEEE
jgi:hypothetical protein